MEEKNVSLRTALMVSLLVMMIIPAVATALFALPTFSSSLNNEAMKSVKIASNVSQVQLAELQTQRQAQLDSLARDVFSDPVHRTPAGLREQLRRQDSLLTYDCLLWIGRDGMVYSSTSGVVIGQVDWPQLMKRCEVGRDDLDSLDHPCSCAQLPGPGPGLPDRPEAK